MKATEHYFPVVLFITLYKKVLTFAFSGAPNKKILANYLKYYFLFS